MKLLQLSLAILFAGVVIHGFLTYGFLGYGGGTLVDSTGNNSNGTAETADATKVSAIPAERGRALAAEAGCAACHSLDGSAGIGPSWMGSYGSMRTFADGGTAMVDETYLRRSMLQPGAQVVAGFENVMLPLALTEEQIADLIALIRELSYGALSDGLLPPGELPPGELSQ